MSEEIEDTIRIFTKNKRMTGIDKVVVNQLHSQQKKIEELEELIYRIKFHIVTFRMAMSDGDRPDGYLEKFSKILGE